MISLKMKLLATSTLFVLFMALTFHWTVNRIFVPERSSLMLRYKGPLLLGKRIQAKNGHFAQDGEIGVREKLCGPGRHFYSPIWWERKIIKDQVVETGSVAIVRSMLGDDLPANEYLVDGNLGESKYKGILRKAYGPGVYRAHPYAYEFVIVDTVQRDVGNQIKHSGWVSIPTGYVGVVTNQQSIPSKNQLKGVQSNVLPPGIYPINGREQEIDIIEIGFRETSIKVENLVDAKGDLVVDETGEPQVKNTESGISFPSNDGFTIQIDFTTIWGIMPEQAPEAVSTFGNIKAIEQKVVLPQTESICRNEGSLYPAVELLVGDDRQKFQIETSNAFEKVLNDKHLTLLYGLVEHIYIPMPIRTPIQQKFIADEEKLTADQEQITAREEGRFVEAERQVLLESAQVTVNTERLFAERIAEGAKQVAEIAAEKSKLVAAIDRQTAELQAKADIVKGEAAAQAEKLYQEALSQKFQLAVQSFGSGQAFNQWKFANELPEDIEFQFLYAGEGTFWTDIDNFTDAAIGKQLNETIKKK